MIYTSYSLIVGGVLFLGMLLMLEMGRRAGLRRFLDDATGARTGLGAIDAAVFSLLGLLIAFSFSGAAARFDARRQLAPQEANAIGTAWLRLDLLPPAAQVALRQLFRDYLDSRLAVARKLPDVNAARKELERCDGLQNAIWSQSVSVASASTSPPIPMLLLPALNQMFDIAATRNATAQIHPPLIIFVTLFLLSLACALMAGHGMAGTKKRSWMHSIGLAAAVSVTVLVIVDIEYPRAGLIRMNAVDQILVDLRQSMDESQ